MQECAGTFRELMLKKCVHLTRMQRGYLCLKRLIDIAASFCGLLLLWPLFLLIALVIKAEDPTGSVFYIQNRIGRNGVPFKLFKFRSMRSGTPELSTHEFTDAQSYVTRAGRILRKTSLDELPQLWNVLIGDMSLIGPRPLLPREREVHMLRFCYGLYQVRPGITGLAQTHGRDAMDDCDKVRWDRTYVQKLSIWMDAALLWRTFIKVVIHEGVADCAKASSENQKIEVTGVVMSAAASHKEEN